MGGMDVKPIDDELNT